MVDIEISLHEVIFPYQDICLQVNVIYTCTGIGSNLITWTVPNLMGGTEQLQSDRHCSVEIKSRLFLIIKNASLILLIY